MDLKYFSPRKKQTFNWDDEMIQNNRMQQVSKLIMRGKKKSKTIQTSTIELPTPAIEHPLLSMGGNLQREPVINYPIENPHPQTFLSNIPLYLSPKITERVVFDVY